MILPSVVEKYAEALKGGGQITTAQLAGIRVSLKSRNGSAPFKTFDDLKSCLPGIRPDIQQLFRRRWPELTAESQRSETATRR